MASALKLLLRKCSELNTAVAAFQASPNTAGESLKKAAKAVVTAAQDMAKENSAKPEIDTKLASVLSDIISAAGHIENTNYVLQIIQQHNTNIKLL